MKYFIAAGLILFPILASAQAYKCTGTDGRVVYQQSPCGGASQGGKVVDAPSLEQQLANQYNYELAQQRRYREQLQRMEVEQRSLEQAQLRQQMEHADADRQTAARNRVVDQIRCDKATRSLRIAANGIYRKESERTEAVRAAEVEADAACGTNAAQRRHERDLAEINARERRNNEKRNQPRLPSHITDCTGGFCYDDQGGVYHSHGDGTTMTGSDGRTCVQTGTTLQCY